MHLNSNNAVQTNKESNKASLQPTYNQLAKSSLDDGKSKYQVYSGGPMMLRSPNNSPLFKPSLPLF